MSHIDDLVTGGYWPLQHFDDAAEAALRFTRFATRVTDRDDKGRYEVEEEHNGDVMGATLWPARAARKILDLGGPNPAATPETKRDISGYMFAWPAVATEASETPTTIPPSGKIPPQTVQARPIVEEDLLADPRFEDLECSTPIGVAAGTHGIVISAAHERRQVPIFFPIGGRADLIAVHHDGDPTLGSLVHDLNAADEFDPIRQARLHSFMRVYRLPQNARIPFGVPPEQGLAWQIGLDVEGHAGRGVVADRGGFASSSSGGRRRGGFVPGNDALLGGPGGAGPGGTAFDIQTLAAASVWAGGPFDVGDAGDPHRLGVTPDGEEVNSLHLSTRALWINGRGDGPLDFKDAYYNASSVSGNPVEVELRWDPNDSHSWVNGRLPGKWRWQVNIPFFEITTEDPPPGNPTGEPPPTTTEPPAGPGGTTAPPTGRGGGPSGAPGGGAGPNGASGAGSGVRVIPRFGGGGRLGGGGGISDAEIDRIIRENEKRRRREEKKARQEEAKRKREEARKRRQEARERKRKEAEERTERIRKKNAEERAKRRKDILDEFGSDVFDPEDPKHRRARGIDFDPETGLKPPGWRPRSDDDEELDEDDEDIIPRFVPRGFDPDTLQPGQGTGDFPLFSMGDDPICRPHWASDGEMSFPGILARPVNTSRGLIDHRNSRASGIRPSEPAPITMRIEAWGEQRQDGWEYTSNPCVGRYPGGTSKGGFYLLPPEIGIDDGAMRPDNVSRTFFTTKPGDVFFGSGTPDTDTGDLADGFYWGVTDLTANLYEMRRSTDDANLMASEADTLNVGWGTITPGTVLGGTTDEGTSTRLIHLRDSTQFTQYLIEGDGAGISLVDAGGATADERWIRFKIDDSIAGFNVLNDDGTIKCENLLAFDLADCEVDIGGALNISGDIDAAGGFRKELTYGFVKLKPSTSVTCYSIDNQNAVTSKIADRAGSIVGLTIKTTAALGAGTITAQLLINGAPAIGASVTLTGALDKVSTTFTKDTFAAFAAGDDLEITLTTNAGIPAAGQDTTVNLYIES